jgi:hypothetical protein
MNDGTQSPVVMMVKGGAGQKGIGRDTASQNA